MQKKFAIREIALMMGLRWRITTKAEAMADAATTRKKTESRLTGGLGLSTVYAKKLVPRYHKLGRESKTRHYKQGPPKGTYQENLRHTTLMPLQLDTVQTFLAFRCWAWIEYWN